jgi:hypothetical protein
MFHTCRQGGFYTFPHHPADEKKPRRNAGILSGYKQFFQPRDAGGGGGMGFEKLSVNADSQKSRPQALRASLSCKGTIMNFNCVCI